MLSFVLLVIMTIIGAIAALFLKRASNFTSIKELLPNINLYLGGGFYFISALLNIFILKYLDYSTVFPLTSLTYVWTMMLSYFVLKEKIGIRKLIGVTGIVISAVLIAI